MVILLTITSALVSMRIRFQVHEHIAQANELFDEPIFDQMANAMPLIYGKFRVDLDVNVRKILQTALSHPELFNLPNSSHLGGNFSNLLEEFGIGLRVE